MHDVTAEHQAHRYQQCKNAVLEILAGAPDATTTATATATEVLHVIGTQLGWPYVRLWLVDAVSDLLLPAAVFTAPDAQTLPLPNNINRGHGLAGICWQRGEPVWVPDIHLTPAATPARSGRSRHEPRLPTGQRYPFSPGHRLSRAVRRTAVDRDVAALQRRHVPLALARPLDRLNQHGQLRPGRRVPSCPAAGGQPMLAILDHGRQLRIIDHRHHRGHASRRT